MAGEAKFELFVGTDGLVYFHLRAANGQIVASGQGYENRENAVIGVESVKAIAADAPIVDLSDS